MIRHSRAGLTTMPQRGRIRRETTYLHHFRDTKADRWTQLTAITIMPRIDTLPYMTCACTTEDRAA